MTRSWINFIWIRMFQHIIFWMLSFFIFLNLFKIGYRPLEIDYVYTALFHLFILPPVYINLLLLLPQFGKKGYWWRYVIAISLLGLLFSWLNFSFFSKWSDDVLPEYFFISYFSFFKISLFFVVYLFITSLLKLSKSWFIVSDLEKKLLIAEKEKAVHSKELLELEARALRAQMNPHFIFNCMNSIKALIQNDEKQRSVDYLTTFSKLIRTLFQNCDKRQISLFDELETCRLYIQLEAMRLDGKLKYNFDIDPDLDLKSVMVPALIIQPFIENAIWHGIVPKAKGIVNISIKGNENAVVCEVDDDGVGRKRSMINKPVTPVMHHSKGVTLSQARLDLEKMLNETNASIRTIDKYDISEPKGTKVIITFSLN